MKTRLPVHPGHFGFRNSKSGRHQARGSVLVIVMAVCFGLVAMALYFANSMSMELRSADNRVAGDEAEEAIEGGACYVRYVLTNLVNPSLMPDPQVFSTEQVKVGNANFWILGRQPDDTSGSSDTSTTPYFGLIDEASKLNLNYVTVDQLGCLPITDPNYTADLIQSIVNWRTGSNSTTAVVPGADDNTYLQLQPPYDIKGANYESVDELRFVYQMNMSLLYGEDANLNGFLDPTENDGDRLPPSDNGDGKLDRGLYDYLTVYSYEPFFNTNGAPRTNINDTAGMQTLLTNTLGATGRTLYNSMYGGAGGGGRGGGGGGGATTTYRSILQWYATAMTAGLSQQDFWQIEDNLMQTNANSTAAYTPGLVNVNTASLAVLSCIPGLTNGQASQLIGYRQSNNTIPTSDISWVANVLSAADATSAGPYLTGRSYQYCADIVAVGHLGRGYRRTRFIFDTSDGTPRIIYRRDLSHLGWALGADIRQQIAAGKLNSP